MPNDDEVGRLLRLAFKERSDLSEFESALKDIYKETLQEPIPPRLQTLIELLRDLETETDKPDER